MHGDHKVNKCHPQSIKKDMSCFLSHITIRIWIIIKLLTQLDSFDGKHWRPTVQRQAVIYNNQSQWDEPIGDRVVCKGKRHVGTAALCRCVYPLTIREKRKHRRYRGIKKVEGRTNVTMEGCSQVPSHFMFVWSPNSRLESPCLHSGTLPWTKTGKQYAHPVPAKQTCGHEIYAK